jgi:hypothetical protein
VLVAQAAGRRGAGESATGDIRQTTRDDLVECFNVLNRTGPSQETVECYGEIVRTQPGNPEAETYLGWTLVLIGQQSSRDELVDSGLSHLDAAVESDPAYPDARVFRAVTYDRLGRTDDAVTELEALEDLDLPVFMEQLVAPLRERLLSQ